MGSKTIIFLGVLVSALYLYYAISNYAVVKSGTIISPESVAQTVNEVKPEIVEEVPSIIEEEIVIKNANERISTPAFGFMAGENKNQIVALMSDNDENGSLVKQMEALCKKRECSKDMRYENDIMDASWQKEAIEIIELLTDGSIENGSLFIEGNVLKLEGTIKSQKTQDVLNDILNAAKSDTFKIENYTKLSEQETLKNSEIKKVETKKEVVAKKVEKVKPVPVVEKEAVSIPVVNAESTMDTTLDTQSEITVEHSIDEDIKAEGVIAKPLMKETSAKSSSTKKRVVKIKAAPKHEIIPAPVMETTLDAESRVRAILSEIKDSKPAVGVVAKPYMKTTAE